MLNHYDPYLVAADLKRDKWIFVIGIGKLIKGLLLFAAGVGALKLLGKDLASELNRWIERLNVDPHNQYFVSVLSKVKGLDGRKIVLVTIGTFVYASLFLTEAIGLLLCKRWGEYVTVIITGSFLPLEIYELARKFSVAKTIAIVLNAAIVVYLIWRLRTKD